VRSSGRRKRSSVAYWEGDKVVVVVPARLPRATQRDTVDWLVGRLLAKTPGIVASDADLEERAIALADRYHDHVRPTSIRWATNQTRRWGSCSPESGQIRISERLRRVPGWVLDAIIVHELAHLVIADHSGAFRALADRYPRQHDAARGEQANAERDQRDVGTAAQHLVPDQPDCVERERSADAILVRAAQRSGDWDADTDSLQSEPPRKPTRTILDRSEFTIQQTSNRSHGADPIRRSQAVIAAAALQSEAGRVGRRRLDRAAWPTGLGFLPPTLPIPCLRAEAIVGSRAPT
jgi:hypothetical protein